MVRQTSPGLPVSGDQNSGLAGGNFATAGGAGAKAINGIISAGPGSGTYSIGWASCSSVTARAPTVILPCGGSGSFCST